MTHKDRYPDDSLTRHECEIADGVAARRPGLGSTKVAAGAYRQIAPVETLPPRRLLTSEAAAYLGCSIRTLEEWRALWRRAQTQGRPELRRGPPFVRIRTQVFYEISDLDAFRDTARAKTPTAASLPDDPCKDHPHFSIPASTEASHRSAVTP